MYIYLFALKGVFCAYVHIRKLCPKIKKILIGLYVQKINLHGNKNSKIFKEIQNEYKKFSNYIWSFTNNKVVYEIGKTSSELSDIISKDLQKRGMKFVGTTIIYSYLQAIGVIYSHDKECFLNNKGANIK